MGISVEDVMKKKSAGVKPKSLKRGLNEMFQPSLVKTKSVEMVPQEKEEAHKEISVVEKKEPVAKKISKPENKRTTKSLNKKRIKTVKPTKTKEELSIVDSLSVPKEKYTKVHNALIEKMIASNMSGNELKLVLMIIREGLGWERNYILLSKREWAEKTGANEQTIYRVREVLEGSGWIGFGVDSTTGKNYYYLKRNIIEEESEDIRLENLQTSLEDYGIDSNNIGKEYETGERLVLSGHSEDLLISMIEDIKLKGSIKGEPVRFPLRYAEKAFELLNARLANEKNSQNFSIERIADYLYERCDSTDLKEEELDWINSKGGKLHLTQRTSEFELNNLLRDAKPLH